MLDTRELGRRPGSQRQVSRTEWAPTGLTIDMLGVPEDSELALDLRLEAVMEGVLVTGTVRVQVEGQCVRCLGGLDDSLVVDLLELYAYDDHGVEDDDVSQLEGDLIDLQPAVRDAVVLALPFNPTCRPDCPGLCPSCGARLADDPGHTHAEEVDPRWVVLHQMVAEADQGKPDHPGPEKE